MSEAMVDLNWLCNWLEENSSGVYRPAKEAAHVIRSMQSEINDLRAVLAKAGELKAIDENSNDRGEPDAIYLQLHDAEEGNYRAEGVTWCWHKINHDDVRYIRDGLARTQAAGEQDPVGEIYSIDMGYTSSFRQLVNGEIPVGTKLYAHPLPAPSIPEGYVPAPLEPDDAMIDAGVAMALQVSVHGQGGWSKYITGLYKQMIAARPKPEASQ